jgi:geranylgeranyl pyrophosphate synthase
MTLETCRSISGEYTPNAFLAASAVELIMDAGFMFDNVADDELDEESGLTPPEELAIAITTLCCGVAMAHEAMSFNRNSNLAIQSAIQIQVNSIAACAGQFLDAYLQKSKNASIEQALNMTCLKSGSIGKLAGEFGASVATDDGELIALLGDLGFNIFTYLQLIDDLRDAFPNDSVPTDFIQNKKTVPLVFFYNSFEQEMFEQNSDILLQGSEEQNKELRRRFQSSGSTSFCAIVAEVYLNRAKTNLRDLRCKIDSVEGLERLVSSVEIAPHQVALAS